MILRRLSAYFTTTSFHFLLFGLTESDSNSACAQTLLCFSQGAWHIFDDCAKPGGDAGIGIEALYQRAQNTPPDARIPLECSSSTLLMLIC